MRISDWSSDVCSSDLLHRTGGVRQVQVRRHFQRAVFRALRIQLVALAEPAAAGSAENGHGQRGGGEEADRVDGRTHRSEEHTSELQSLMRISYAVFCLKKKNIQTLIPQT